ncbi:MAG: hypothetical protein AAF615_06870 [Pseudomonadota bacterium]
MGFGLLVAGCGAGVVTPATTAIGQFFESDNEEQTTIDPALLRPEAACPVITILPETESIRRDDGSGGEGTLRWQASITKTARSCTPGAEGTAIRVGVSGRVIEGPRGAPEAVELPVRVAVREAGEVTYSRLHNVQVTRSGPSQDWAFVDEAIVVEKPESAEIVVGFDG